MPATEAGLTRRVSRLGALAFLAGCAGPAAAPTVVARASSPACLAGGVLSEQSQPGRVLVSNRTDRDLHVLVDGCGEHILLGAVPSAAEASLRLPRRLFAFRDGLRFHAFSVLTRERYGSYAVMPERPVSRLVISPDAPRLGITAPEASPSPIEWSQAISTYVGDDWSYASAFSNSTPSVLTWQCLGGRPLLTLSATGALEREPVVSFRFGTRAARDYGAWEVVRSIQDGVIAPDHVLADLTRRAIGHTSAQVSLSTEQDVPQGHSFLLRGLKEALARMPCLVEVLDTPLRP